MENDRRGAERDGQFRHSCRCFRVVPLRSFAVGYPVCKLPGALQARLKQRSPVLMRGPWQNDGANVLRPGAEVSLLGRFFLCSPRENPLRSVGKTQRALNWVKEYVNRRRDQGEALFVVGRRGRPMRVQAPQIRFKRFRLMVGFPKPVTAHMLRHTVATTLLFNGWPIGHIKDILGHDRLITTCNFYLGADKRAAKKAHGDFLDYERGE
jgi:integrase